MLFACVPFVLFTHYLASLFVLVSLFPTGQVTEFPLRQANEALLALREGRFEGAAVLRVGPDDITVPS